MADGATGDECPGHGKEGDTVPCWMAYATDEAERNAADADAKARHAAAIAAQKANAQIKEQPQP
jgi:hypothetical protein